MVFCKGLRIHLSSGLESSAKVGFGSPRKAVVFSGLWLRSSGSLACMGLRGMISRTQSN